MSDPKALADRLLHCLRQRERIAPFSRDMGLTLAEAYRVGAEVEAARIASGERPVGRKIGFTNRTIWEEYNVSAPIFGTMYDSTVHPLGEAFDPSSLLEPRIEPEIAFRLSAVPERGMRPEELIACVSHVCAGFELVQSVFPGWVFEAADTVAAFGLHGAFLHGPMHEVRPEDAAEWVERLSGFRTTLLRNGEVMDEGHAANVLGGGPLVALGHLADLLPGIASAAPLAEGEIVTTGTLTRALPVAAGETWAARFEGLPIGGIDLALGRSG